MHQLYTYQKNHVPIISWYKYMNPIHTDCEFVIKAARCEVLKNYNGIILEPEPEPFWSFTLEGRK